MGKNLKPSLVPKLKPKQPVQAIENSNRLNNKKSVFQKKKIMLIRIDFDWLLRDLEIETNRLDCRIYTVYVHEDSILDVYNT